jgi:dolichol-phosphate mannosyltransferase
MVIQSTKNSSAIAISILIPIHNEQGNIGPLISAICHQMAGIGASWELLVIDDGSTDESKREVDDLLDCYDCLRLLSYATNLGQSYAIWTGIQATSGDVIVTIDGDGQLHSKDIVTLLREITNGADMAIGKRVHRRDSFSKRLFSIFANKLRQTMTGSKIEDSGCALRAFRRELSKDLFPFRALHRFLPQMLELSGHKVSVVPIDHVARKYGKSHYGFFDRLIPSILDGLAILWLYKRRFSKACPDGFCDSQRRIDPS